jgi:hypothetical protein
MWRKRKLVMQTTQAEVQIPVAEEEKVAGKATVQRKMRDPTDEALALVVEEEAGIRAIRLRKTGTLMVNKVLAVVAEEGARIRVAQRRKTVTLVAVKKVLAVEQDVAA